MTPEQLAEFERDLAGFDVLHDEAVRRAHDAGKCTKCDDNPPLPDSQWCEPCCDHERDDT
jgi:hypothetical protein